MTLARLVRKANAVFGHALPNAANYYKYREIVPTDLLGEIARAKSVNSENRHRHGKGWLPASPRFLPLSGCGTEPLWGSPVAKRVESGSSKSGNSEHSTRGASG